MALSVIFHNHGAAVGAIDALNELDLGFIIKAGWEERKIIKKIRKENEEGKEMVKERAQLIIEVPPISPRRSRKLVAKVETLVSKYGGVVVH